MVLVLVTSQQPMEETAMKNMFQRGSPEKLESAPLHQEL
jgi:hypothetical protein